jgi:hypothetical protein
VRKSGKEREKVVKNKRVREKSEKSGEKQKSERKE